MIIEIFLEQTCLNEREEVVVVGHDRLRRHIQLDLILNLIIDNSTFRFALTPARQWSTFLSCSTIDSSKIIVRCAILLPRGRRKGADIDARILNLLRSWHLSIQSKNAKSYILLTSTTT